MIPHYQLILLYSLYYHINIQAFQMASMLQHFMTSVKLYDIIHRDFQNRD